MSRRSSPLPDRSAAIERRMGQLRQIAARIEVEALIASEFARAGRPLSPDAESGFFERDEIGPAQATVDEEVDPYPPATRRAFWMGAVVAAAAVAAMTWLGPW